MCPDQDRGDGGTAARLARAARARAAHSRAWHTSDWRTRPWRGTARTVLLDAVLIIAGVVVYFRTRGLTVGATDTAVAHAHDIMRLEQDLGLDIERGAQAVVGSSGPLITLANWIYIWGHWPVIAATFIWLALHNRLIFRRLRNAMLVSGAMGLCVYTTYPVAPPRLAGIGLVDTISEQSSSYRVLQPPAFVNPYAAMPSLHVGWNLLVGLALVAAAGTVVMRTVGRVMPVAMAAATVVTANHYVLDLVAGMAFGLIGYLVALRLEKRAERVRGDPAVATGPEPYDPVVPIPRPAPEAPAPAAPAPAAPAPASPARCRRGG